MKFKASDWEFISAKCKKEGMYDMIIYNPYTRELFNERVEAEYLSGVDSYGERYSAKEIKRETFDIIARKLFMDGGESVGFFDEGDDEEAKDPDEVIPRETALKAVRGELTEDELSKVVQVDIERGNYYDFDAFMNVIHRFMRGEISRGYYVDWVITVAWALDSNTFKENSRKDLLYTNLSDRFDGHSFDELEGEMERECNEMIACLKYYNHLIVNAGRATPPTFYNEEKIAVYVCFDFCNHHNVHYKLCVADEKKHVFRITTIANPFYLENVNYTFTDNDDFEDLTSEYYDFYHDKNMDIHKYIKELPYLNINGEPIG